MPIAGEDILQTAGKRLENKTGISGVELTIAGSAMITQYRNKELQSFSHAIIVSGKTEKDIAIKEDATGENFWAELNQVDALLPSCFDIVRMIEDGKTWLEVSYDLQ